jgi:hypothetical protein
MTELIKKFNYNVRWNAFESVCYKAILTLHQTCFFYLANRLIYGFSSFLFAIIYLTVELVNFGLDRSIAQLFGDYFGYDKNLKYYLMPQLALQLFFLLFLGLITIKYNILNRLVTTSIEISLDLALLILGIIFCESIRKTLRLISQLFFLNKPVAYLELSLIVIYVSLFWLSYFTGYQISLNTIYIPLLLQSLIGILGLLYLILPQIKLLLIDSKASGIINYKHASTRLNWRMIFYYRAQNYLYQLSELLFTSNFLIYFFTHIVGVLNIGPIKLANYFAVFIKALLERTLGLASLAVFAKNKHLIVAQKTIFDIAQRRLNLVLTNLIIIFSACALIAGASNFINNNLYLALLFLLFTIVNNFFIIYEQFFLINNRILFLFGLNLVCLTSFLGLLHTYPALYLQANLAYLILILASLRIMTLLIVKIFTKKIW